MSLSGRSLIEASAGTGKTYAIVCLYLRLLIEKALTPEQILVVTYTEAATEELRGRIRRKIREAHEVFAGSGTEDDFLEGLRDKINRIEPGLSVSRDRLDKALKSFDLASIFTIHGFCLRALQENVFESGSPYDMELITDQTDLLQEIVDDFWRMRFFAESAPLLGYTLRNRFSPDNLAVFLKGMLGHPKMETQPAFSGEEIASLEKDCAAAFTAVRDEWAEHKSEITTLLRTDTGLSRSADSYRNDILPGLFEEMDAFVNRNNPFDLFSGFDRYATSGIISGTKPTGIAPQHPFFALCQDLKEKVEKRFLALKWELIAFGRERLPSRKREINVRFFDDLLSDLYDALHRKGGDRLGESLRNKHRAALIDEFQDTDPVQYDIFRSIYRDESCPLFLIGDPKQAIYSFRGADIFAYLEAASDVDSERRFTLRRNRRSTAGLLAALNSVFGKADKPFVYDAIEYFPVKPGGKKNAADCFVLSEFDPAPLQVWYVPQDHDGNDLNVGKASEVIPRAVAFEISRLLQAGKDRAALIDGRPLLPEDIAVIVRTHNQAALIQDALRTLRIPSVMRSDRSIFSTEEANEVCTLLAALADPRNESAVRAALVTGILGRTGDDIAALLEDERAWEECLEKFRAYRQSWLEQGFMVMAQALMAGESVQGRLLRHPDGERRLTNLLHCFEIIHNAAHEQDVGIEGLVTWFGERVSGEEAAEEYQIRLETDEKAVKIVTVHLSKGLEFPIVFCPFLWGGVRAEEGAITFHEGYRMIKDFGSAEYERRRAAAQQETLAENLRLFYVALTRAKFRCYLVGGKIIDKTGKNRPETSPQAWLFHSSAGVQTSPDVVSRLAEEVKTLPAGKVRLQLSRLAAEGNGNISVMQMPDSAEAAAYVEDWAGEGALACRKFSGAIDRTWRVASFTSLAAHDAPAAELPDRDETPPADAQAGTSEEPQERSLFSFPRGARAGVCLHEIFEKIDFAAYSADTVSGQVRRSLEKHGFGAEWNAHICAMVNHVLNAGLPSPAGTFTLADLKRGSWITELEFFFPLRFITSDRLREHLQIWGAGCGAVDLPRLCSTLSFKPVKGMVRGFIDMVFEHGNRYYLLDWKSNHLGNRLEDYGKEALKAAMGRRLYPLQYLLYTVALNRYLSLRVPGYDYAAGFGGVFYIFLRGVNPRGGSGIFEDIPAAELIRELTGLLVEAEG